MIVCGGNQTVIQNEKNEVYVCGGGSLHYLDFSDEENRHKFKKVNLKFGHFGFSEEENQYKFEKVIFEFGKIKNIVCGENFAMIQIQNKQNEVYVCGYNGRGQLGLGDEEYRCEYEKVDYDFGEIKNMACGRNHTAIQNEKNEIYVCGLNYSGQLGLSDNTDRNRFEKVVFDFGKIKKIACGQIHTIVQNEKNEVYVCGGNDSGQLGLGDCEDRDKFEKAECDFGGIKNITCGRHHTIIQNVKNEIYVCGDNRCGQLGLGDKKNRDKFEKVEYNLGKIKNIACGDFYTVVQNEKDEIYVCGLNHSGQLGLGDNENRDVFEKVVHNFREIKNIVCGGYHTIIQNEKNEVYVCGYNEYGQLGLGDNKNRNKFEKVDTDDIFGKKS